LALGLVERRVRHVVDEGDLDGRTAWIPQASVCELVAFCRTGASAG
jgi:hypothetical protein